MVKQNRAESLRQALLRVLGFDQAQAGGHLARAWDLPEALVAAITHYPKVDYRGPHGRITTTVGLAAKLVSAVLKEESCPDPDNRLTGLGIENESFAGVFEQLRGQMAKVRAIAKVLI
jgi:HD-like signal output (HDOD) protein